MSDKNPCAMWEKMAQKSAKSFALYSQQSATKAECEGANTYTSSDGNTYQYITDGRLAVRYNVPYEGIRKCKRAGINLDSVFDSATETFRVDVPDYETLKRENAFACAKQPYGVHVVRISNGTMYEASALKAMLELLGTNDDVTFRATKDKPILTASVTYGTRTIEAVLYGLLIRNMKTTDFVIDMKA